MGSVHHRAWAIENPGNAAARHELREAIVEAAADRIAAGARALDVGCGTGWLLEALEGAGAPAAGLHGIEPDPARLAAARARVPGAAIERGDARRLPFPDHTFGIVSLIVVLSSLQPPSAVVPSLIESRRVLAPYGVLLVYEPRLPNPFNSATHLVRRRQLDDAGLVPREERSLTLIPQIGRRLGALTPTLHPALSRVPALRGHLLAVYRAPHSPVG